MTQIPFVDLRAQQARIKPRLEARIQAVLAHGQFILGPEVAELETALAKFAEARHAVCVSSGTDALLIALMAEGVGAGDAVFLPSFTFPGTAGMVALLGATPVFVDVEEASFNIDLAHLEASVNEVERRGALVPRAVLPVDLFGLPADYAALSKIAVRHGLAVIADAAQSFGGSRDGKPVGSLASVTATSFFPAKPFGCYGDGGALFTESDERAMTFRSLRAHGAGDDKYDIVRIGLNARLDTLQAAVLLAKLEVFEEELTARARLAELYDEVLDGAVTLPPRCKGSSSAWAQYSILVKRRETVVRALKAEGIPFAIYYPRPLHLQPAFVHFGNGEGSLPVSERLSAHILSLPIHAYLPEQTAVGIAATVRRAVRS